MARKVQVVCNKCGKTINTELQPCLSINTTFGYGTPYDGEDLQLDLCLSCMEELFESCVIYPICKKETIL